MEGGACSPEGQRVTRSRAAAATRARPAELLGYILQLAARPLPTWVPELRRLEQEEEEAARASRWYYSFY